METLETQAEVHHDAGGTPADHEDSLDVGNVFTKMAEEEIAFDAEQDSSAEEVTAEKPKETPREEVIETLPAEEKPVETVEAAVDKTVEKVDDKVTAEVTTEKSEEQKATEAKAKEDADKAKAEAEALAAKATPEVTQEDKDKQSAELMSLLNERREETIEVLAKNHFALNDEQFRELDENPREYIPKMLGRLYLDAVQGSVAAMLGQMPQVIKSLNDTQAANEAAEKQFYDQFPVLKTKPEYIAHVKKVTTLHRQLNPKASLDDMIRDVGLQTSLAFKLPVPESIRATGKSDTVMPHVPAGADSQKPAESPGAVKELNPYTQMAEDMLEDDAL